MEYELRRLSPDDGLDVYDMLQDFDAEEYGFTNEAKGMSYAEYSQWLIREDDISKARNMPENWVPQTTYFLYVDGCPVGVARIRHYSSEFLEKQGVGNFGYGIAKAFRGKGYGNVLFREVLKKSRVLGYDRIKSFVRIDNAASNRVFLRNGARLAGVFEGIKNIYETDV